jgi:hypothetical protein
MFTNVKETDVLCGRGGRSNQHPGNRMFRRVANENRELYQKCEGSSRRKHLLVVSIVNAIHHHGGRFVKKQKDSWVEIAHKEACGKTSQALRDSSEPSDDWTSSTTTTTSSSKSKSAMRQKRTSKSEPPQQTTRERTPRTVRDVCFQASSTVRVKSSDGDACSNQQAEQPQQAPPSVVEYSLADFGEGLLSEVESLADFLGDLLSEDDAAFEIEKDVEQSCSNKNTSCSLIPDEEEDRPPLPTREQSDDDLSPLVWPNEFLFQSESEYEDLCRGLGLSVWMTISRARMVSKKDNA